MSDDATKQRRISKQYYLFEDVLWQLPGFVGLKKPISIAALQLYAGLIWTKEGRKDPCPLIRPRHSSQAKEKPASYYLDGVIHLLPKHRNLACMLHELAHALGNRDKQTHGAAFRRRCIRLYKEYGGWNGVVDWERA